MTFQYKPILSGILLALVLVDSASGACTSKNPIAGQCYCHFAGACDWTKTPPAPFANAASAMPITDIESTFAKTPANPNTAEICEGDTLAILYDCDLRIPLLSARVLPDVDLIAPYSSRLYRTNFRKSQAISAKYSQNTGDYGPRAKDQIPCYESRPPRGRAVKMYYNIDWLPAKVKIAAGAAPKPCVMRTARKHMATIDMGHLIASNYGKSAANPAQSVSDTFYLTNIVPQFSDLNRVSWLQHEQGLLRWATQNCASTSGNRQNARLFILVGTIPSTFGHLDKRYFGFPGFSNFQAKSGKKVTKAQRKGRPAYKFDYRINVPAVMWSAACCEFEELNPTTNAYDQKYITSAFFGLNKPFQPKTWPVSLASLFNNICAIVKCPKTMPVIDLFPNQPLCQ